MCNPCYVLQVSLARLFGLADTEADTSQCLLPASLASCGAGRDQEEDGEELESVVFKPEKECLGLLYRNLLDVQ